jgi:hypothetical protein
MGWGYSSVGTAFAQGASGRGFNPRNKKEKKENRTAKKKQQEEDKCRPSAEFIETAELMHHRNSGTAFRLGAGPAEACHLFSF